MNLLEVRTQFVKSSGRYDLVVDATSYANAGADYYIQEGQRWLERRADVPGGLAELAVTLSQGDVLTEIERARAVLEVSISNSDSDLMVQLSKSSIKDLRHLYGQLSPSLASVEQGQPRYYAVGIPRSALGSAAVDRHLVTMPPADRDYTLLVKCLLESSQLSSNDSESWWSLNHPSVLVKAALLQLEMEHRNTEGVRDMVQAIDLELEGIEFDYVEEQTSEMEQVLNSWDYIRYPRKAERYEEE